MKTLWCRAHAPIATLRVDQSRPPLKPEQIRWLEHRMPGQYN
jgi:hypothetical protein